MTENASSAMFGGRSSGCLPCRRSTVCVQLSNVGLSDAMKVTLVTSLLGGDDAFRVGDLARGESREIVVSDPEAELGVLVAAADDQRRPPWRVHWSSPIMGAAASYENVGIPQIF